MNKFNFQINVQQTVQPQYRTNLFNENDENETEESFENFSEFERSWLPTQSYIILNCSQLMYF